MLGLSPSARPSVRPLARPSGPWRPVGARGWPVGGPWGPSVRPSARPSDRPSDRPNLDKVYIKFRQSLHQV